MTNDTKELLETLQDIAARNRPERRRERYSVRKSIEAIKAAIPIEVVAREYVEELRETGSDRLVGRCVAPDHADNTPSLVIYKETDTFTCFGCGIWGDVLDLEMYRGYHDDLWTAIVALSLRHSVELPRRPRSWHERQGEKAAVEAQIIETITRGYQRRFFRVFGDTVLENIEDECEREEEARRLFDDFYPAARAAARNRLERHHG